MYFIFLCMKYVQPKSHTQILDKTFAIPVGIYYTELVLHKTVSIGTMCYKLQVTSLLLSDAQNDTGSDCLEGNVWCFEREEYIS